MTIWVKICGMTTPEAVDAAVEAGANAIGFVFHAASPRNIQPAEAAALSKRIPEGIQRCAVMRHPSAELVQSVLAEFQPDVLQTDAADLTAIALPSGIQRLPVLRTGQLLATGLPDYCLYESAESGHGSRADWAEAAALARRTRLILAGGLDAGSVAEAIIRVQPYGVDVSSGVESERGKKDLAKIKAFVAAARAAALH